MQPHKCDYKQHNKAIKSVLSKGCSGLDLFLDKSTKEKRFWHASLRALVKNIFIAWENCSAPLIGFHNLGRKKDNVQETVGSVPPLNVTGQKLRENLDLSGLSRNVPQSLSGCVGGCSEGGCGCQGWLIWPHVCLRHFIMTAHDSQHWRMQGRLNYLFDGGESNG